MSDRRGFSLARAAVFAALLVACIAVWMAMGAYGAEVGLGDFPLVAQFIAIVAALSLAERTIARFLPRV